MQMVPLNIMYIMNLVNLRCGGIDRRPTVQLNSNLALTHVSLAETRLVYMFAHELIASAQTCLG